MTRNFAPFVYNQNVLVNTSRSTDQAISDAALKSRYPPVTTIASDWAAVGFEANSRSSRSRAPFYHLGDDGQDMGVDIEALVAAQSGPPSSSCGR